MNATIISLASVQKEIQSRVTLRLCIALYSYPVWITEWFLLCFPWVLCWMPAYCSEIK